MITVMEMISLVSQVIWKIFSGMFLTSDALVGFAIIGVCGLAFYLKYKLEA